MEDDMLIQEGYFKNIFNTVRAATLILDENMRVLSANRQSRRKDGPIIDVSLKISAVKGNR
jgi:hypothetical protein